MDYAIQGLINSHDKENLMRNDLEAVSVLRRKQVEQKTGLSRSTLYLRIQEGTFPRPINLGGRAVGWLYSEIEAWLAGKIEGRDAGRRVLQ